MSSSALSYTYNASYNALPYVPGFLTTHWNSGIKNISDPAYHNFTNVTVHGRGDPCKLAGYTGAQIRAMDATQFAAINSGWRMPTAEENAQFVGGTNSNWTLGQASYEYTQGTSALQYNFLRTK